MIVCICRNISDKEITRRVQDGAQFDDLQIDLGIATCCGCCEECRMTPERYTFPGPFLVLTNLEGQGSERHNFGLKLGTPHSAANATISLSDSGSLKFNSNISDNCAANFLC